MIGLKILENGIAICIICFKMMFKVFIPTYSKEQKKAKKKKKEKKGAGLEPALVGL